MPPEADFAILVLNETVTTNENIKMAKLPPKNAKCPLGLKMVVSGWGNDWSSNRPTNKLWAVLQACLPMDRCPKLRSQEKYTICGGDPKEDDNSACHGGSGGNNFRNSVIEIIKHKSIFR